MTEWVKYSPYGVAFGLPGCDTDSDGECDAADITQIDAWIAAPSYDIRGDVDLDGDVDTTDKTIAQTYYQGTTSGWGVLSAQGNRKGYAGYEHDENIGEFLIHVRNRVLHTTLGRWTRRDPLGYVDGLSLYEYVGSTPILETDSSGLSNNECVPPVSWEVSANWWIIAGAIINGGKIKFKAQGTDSKGMSIRLKGGTPVIGSGLAIGWLKGNSSANIVAGCTPVEVGDRVSVAGVGVNFSIVIPINVNWLQYEIGDYLWYDTHYFDIGGIGASEIGMGFGGWINEGEVTYY